MSSESETKPKSSLWGRVRTSSGAAAAIMNKKAEDSGLKAKVTAALKMTDTHTTMT
jgi:hypothetical protein